jgi:hypothetical protein
MNVTQIITDGAGCTVVAIAPAPGPAVGAAVTSALGGSGRVVSVVDESDEDETVRVTCAVDRVLEATLREHPTTEIEEG